MLLILAFLQRVRRRQIYFLLALAAVAIVSGGLASSAVENISIGNGLYWAVTTATTVGYGDVTPHDTGGRVIAHDTGGRVIATLEMPTAIPLFAGVFATVTATVASSQLKSILLARERSPSTKSPAAKSGPVGPAPGSSR